MSIIVPVWNNAYGLTQCLGSLERLDYPNDRLEIIVVDNGSNDASRDVAASFSGVTVLNEEYPGSYSARNKGLRHARGDYLAFIDSDCEASSQWIKAALTAASSARNLGIVAGRIDLVIPEDYITSSAALYESVFAFNQRENAASGLCVTANWISPRMVLERFGGFNAALKSGADMDLARRISSAGYEVIYANSAVVRHSARVRLSDLRAKRRRLWEADGLHSVASNANDQGFYLPLQRGSGVN